ncbi:MULTISPECIES: TonB-dependent hemoglobin/transferrin/lactoferrin family receptor [Campylobacter]|uniref:TonB-dependent hemoglobin/transferrin/lactoferrin family receptor n=1 Tax=Campylobacter TaxID=194 RepID=UPI00027A394D|nr:MULTISPECIES: TonB-dependent hemoglobin/transferrin/lactoferrin family receptor [Campylobacter]EJP74894.1 TonB-dependent hemoglobin/transferrin/lactoferrin receptor family protein [Campylobacter sp. FOBRC14]
MSGNRLKLSLIALLILNTGGLFAADEKDVKLDSIEVIGTTPDDDVKTKKVGETKKSAETLERQQVSDSKDLVKYETGVTVVEGGRFGNSGYAIRGVDENRVAIMIDGLRQAETLSSTGFKELFEGYGNFNNTRNSVEMENVKMATITKGADSMKTGSGALGGSVMFETKDARDYLIDKNWYFGFKNGYQSRDSQNFRSITAAARLKWFDILIVNTLRDGHETKNYFYDIYNGDEDRTHVGRTREKADPYNIQRKSTMVKVGFQPSDEHRFSVMHDDSTLKSNGEDLSYALRSYSYSLQDTALGERLTNDKSTRKNIQVAYENFVETPFWDSFKISYSTQKIKNKARTDEYCNNDGCNNVRNPSGLNMVYDKDAGVYKIVDKNGKELTPESDTNEWLSDSRVFKDSNGNKVVWQDNGGEVNYMFLNCSKVDCTKKFRVSRVYEDGFGQYHHDYVDRDIEILTAPDGTKYGRVKRELDPNGDIEDLRIARPKSAGYVEDQYHDRDLNTDTKQFDINFEKEFELLGMEHSVKYGALFEKTKKSMVDQDGFKGANEKWWADKFYGYKFDPSNPNADANGYVLHPDWYPRAYSSKSNTNAKQTYLIPVETKTTAFFVGDNLKLTDWLGFDLNYRYDKVKHVPKYDTSVPVPKGLIAGIFVPLPGNAYGPGATCGYNTDCMNENIRQNLDILLQNKEFKSDSYIFGLNLDPLSFMRFQVKYSKGFRAPTSDEMYMTFKHPSFSIAPNTNLKAEIAKTKEAALTFYKNQSFISFNVFKTDYENFIDLVFLRMKAVEVGSALQYPFWQNINRDSAKVNGFEISSRVELGDAFSSLEGFRIGYKFTHQKGRMDGSIPMNAIQPTTSVYTLGYSTPGDKYGIDFYITDVGEKKAEDTYNMYWKDQMEHIDPDSGNLVPGKMIKGKPVTDSKMAWRSGNYTVFDLIAYARPAKNFAFSFGLYNITDQKYMTWDSARSIRGFGTTNLIDQNTGAGIKRFYAPGRNFKFTWEIKF